MLALRVPAEIVFAAGNAINVQKAHIEPHGRIECPVLIHTQPGQLVVENLGIFVSGEVTVFSASVGNRFADTMDKLLY
ncbi:hypothetical protein ES703_94981 [subsurface metagenome]